MSITEKNFAQLVIHADARDITVDQHPNAVVRVERYDGFTAEVTLRDDAVSVDFHVAAGAEHGGRKACTLFKSLSDVDRLIADAEISWPSTHERSPRFAGTFARALQIACFYADALDRDYPAGETYPAKASS
jgi:hypothetical protein